MAIPQAKKNVATTLKIHFTHSDLNIKKVSHLFTHALSRSSRTSTADGR